MSTLKTTLPLPPPFRDSHPPPALLAQGAEALVYRTHFLNPSKPCALKYRPPKKWRHPTLDARLTRHRILAEARILLRCQREGVRVPAVLALDWEGAGGAVKRAPVNPVNPANPADSSEQTPPEDADAKSSADAEATGGWMLVEWISGGTVRAALEHWVPQVKGKPVADWPAGRKEALLGLMRRMGEAVGRLHRAGVVHGDLTTSNLMLQRGEAGQQQEGGEVVASEEGAEGQSLDGEIVLIDFGLAAGAVQEEERAVDLYVLERAFGSTHPAIEDYFAEVLEAYGNSYKGAKVVLRRLEDVRQRGRKKSMVG